MSVPVQGDTPRKKLKLLPVFSCVLPPNARDQRPGATDPPLSTRAQSPGSLHLVVGLCVTSLAIHEAPFLQDPNSSSPILQDSNHRGSSAQGLYCNHQSRPRSPRAGLLNNHAKSRRPPSADQCESQSLC